MAIVTDTFGADFKRTSFIKIPDAPRMFTALPRSVVTFTVQTGVVTAKPINDQQVLLVAIDLPLEFAYRMLELNCSLLQDVATSWEPVAHLEITNGIRNLEQGLATRHPTTVVSLPRRAALNMWLTDMVVPSYVMQANRPGIMPTITFEATNVQDPAGAAGTVQFYASFLEYEIEQVQVFPVHSPTLTYGRN